MRGVPTHPYIKVSSVRYKQQRERGREGGRENKMKMKDKIKRIIEPFSV
jgi:hypothetical protein